MTKKSPTTPSVEQHLKEVFPPPEEDRTLAWRVDDPPQYVPEEGWHAEDFPQVTVAFIPFTTYPLQRPDPYISVTTDGWLFIEAGNTRMAIPDRDEWDKLVAMVTRMWNTWARDVEDNHASIEEVLNYQPPAPPPPPEEESPNDPDSPH